MKWFWEFTYEKKHIYGHRPERHRRAHRGRGGLISPAQADWGKIGTAGYANATVPRVAIVVNPNQYPGNTSYGGNGVHTTSFQEFRWTDDPNVPPPVFFASAQLTLNTTGYVKATIGALGNASASVTFSIAPLDGPNKGHAQDSTYGDSHSNQTYYPADTNYTGFQVPSTVKSSGSFPIKTETLPDKSVKRTFLASFDIDVSQSARAHADLGESTATVGATTLTTASIDKQ